VTAVGPAGVDLGRVELGPVELPAYEPPAGQPAVPTATYLARLAAAERAAAGAGLDSLIVYADREHFANLSYLTGYDPRFEEALLILVPGRAPALLVGNEGMAYAKVAPPGVDVLLYQTLSLVSQDRSASPALADILRGAGLGHGAATRPGVVGWKYFGPAEALRPAEWIDAPAFIVDELRAAGCRPVNATALFTEPGRGLRLVSDNDQLACFEFAATHGSQAMRRLLHGIRPGMTELEAFSLLRPTGLPYSYHPVMLSGERAALGLASASGRVMRTGDPVSASIGYWGSNIARGGFLAQTARDLPSAASDYVERLVVPYFACAAAWYETMGIGVTGGQLYDLVCGQLGDPFFGVHLNPGHFIHLDEWPSSPVYRGSDVVLRSGMALQLDIIPATGTAYHTTNVEDGVALADEAARDDLAARYPDLWQRVTARRRFMAEVLGIRLRPEVLPLSDLAGYLPPFWLSPQLAMRRT
jgi:Metallopeptidase family M24/Creatinase/Prolidase N-terminal domain